MKYQRYQDYFKNDVDWLGEAPSTWMVKRVGYFFNERREKVSDKDFQPLSVTKSGIVPQLESAAKSDDGDNRKKVCIGDFVINSRSDRKGSSGASGLDGSVSLINTVIVPNKNIDIKFAHYLFRSTSFQEEYYRYGKGIVADLWSTNYSEMKNISIPIPPLTEQKKIADFLENETANIDFLVLEQQKLIELLKEKKQAVISNAVTKGLNPNVEMKDSGVEWLGEIPENWKLTSVKKNSVIVGRIGFRGYTQEDIVDEGDGAITLSPSNLINGEISLEACTYISWIKFHESPEIQISPGDVVMVKTGSSYGKVAIFDNTAQPEITINPQLVIFKKITFESKFFFYLLQSNYVNSLIKSSNTGGTIPTLTQEYIGNIKIAIPSIDEQQKIIDYLNIKNNEFKLLINEAEKIIDLLTERRFALISAAVTGQIDVRNYQREEAE
jgi:type I restriction enzyme S subunit